MQASTPKNVFTNKPFINWPATYSAFFAPGALSFAKQYDCGLSNLITGLTIEFGNTGTSLTEEQYQAAIDQYMNGALAGDCLCCMRVAEIFAWKNNPFQMKVDSTNSWLYATLAMFYSLCTPFGLEGDIRPIFMEYLQANSDELSLRKTVEMVKASEDPVAKRHQIVIANTLPLFFNLDLSPDQRVDKFKKYLYSLSEHIDECIIGSFLMNIYSGNSETDNPMFESDLVLGYFNSQVIQLFAFHNATFTVANEVHGFMISAFAANAWQFLIWKGKHYEGEIDDCLKELIRMSKFILNPKNKIAAPAFVQNLLIAILGWCYRKGILLKKDPAKAHAYLSRLDDQRTPPNLLFEKAKVKSQLNLHGEAKHIFQIIYHAYQDMLKKAEKDFYPYDYFIMGYIDEKVNKNMKRAKEYYGKGSTLIRLPNVKAFESMAFQRKCGVRLEKLEEQI